MDNLFKRNSRFDALVEDNTQNKKDKKDLKQSSIKDIKKLEERTNTFKNETNEIDKFNFFREKDTRFNSHYGRNRQRTKQEIEDVERKRKEREKLEKERLEQELLKPENFPLLQGSFVTENKNTELKPNYLAKIKETTNNNNNNNLDSDLVNLKPGWVMLTRDHKSGKTIMKTHPSTHFHEPEKSELQIGRDILKALVDLYEKRTQEYIDNYGYDTWEKMFKRPNWREEELEYMSDSDDSDEYDEEEDYDEEYEDNEYLY